MRRRLRRGSPAGETLPVEPDTEAPVPRPGGGEVAAEEEAPEAPAESVVAGDGPVTGDAASDSEATATADEPGAPADGDAATADQLAATAAQPAADAEPAATVDQPDAADAEPAATVDQPDAADAESAATADEPEHEAPPGPAPAVRAARVAEPDPWPDPFAGGRPGALRLAALHLRLGQHSLARAELEALAGRGRLDEPALLDLAEVRWRTGDLPGAGEAAKNLLARGSEAPLALVIAAEAVSALGRPGEARRLSSRALQQIDGPLDPLFAGMPMALIWPVDAPHEPLAAEARTGRGRGRARTMPDSGEGAASGAAEAFAGGRAALAAGDAERAALLLGVAMRLEPGFAQDVLRAVAGHDEPLLALVRGDALRLLVREADALSAFDLARGRPGVAGQAASAGPASPGLFDSDPALADDGRA